MVHCKHVHTRVPFNCRFTIVYYATSGKSNLHVRWIKYREYYKCIYVSQRSQPRLPSLQFSVIDFGFLNQSPVDYFEFWWSSFLERNNSIRMTAIRILRIVRTIKWERDKLLCQIFLPFFFFSFNLRRNNQKDI